MSIASAAARTTVTSAASVAAGVRNATTRVSLLEVQITQVNATAQSVGLYLPTPALEVASTTVTFQRDDSADPAASTVLATTWSTSPLGPSVYCRRWNSAASAGLGVVWSFPAGLTAQLVCLYNETPGDVLDISAIVDE